MDKAVVVLSFDDGRIDNYEVVFDIIRKRKIPATFNIATAYVDGSISMQDSPCQNESMDINDVIVLEKQGVEIAGHGDCHQNTIEDIQQGIEKLKKWLHYPRNQKLGFASPHCILMEDDIFQKRKEFEDLGIFYVRTGIRKKNCFYMRVIRKLAHLSKSTWLYRLGYQDSLETSSGRFVFHSIPVMNRATVNQVKTIIEKAVYQKKVCVLMFHSIVGDDSPYFHDTWSWDRRKFEDLCEWLVKMSSDNRVQLSTMKELVAQGEEI